MRKVYLLFLLLGLLKISYSQVATYNFAPSSGTYNPITGGTVYGTATSDDQRFVDPATPAGGTTLTGVGIPIGFNFTFNGQVFDRIAINYNGWISLGSSSLTPSVDMTSTSSYTSLSSTATNTPAVLRNRIAALSVDLQGRANAELRVETIGTSPSQTLVVQWTNVKPYSTTLYTTDTLNFQIRLSETSNQVTIQYGKCVIASTGSFTPQVGLGGSTSTDFNDRTTTTNWAASTAGTTNAASMALSSTVAPALGQTYTFTQASCLPPATVSFTATAVSSVSISWATVSGAAGYEYKIDTTAAAPSTAGTATIGTTGTATNIAAGSVVYAHVRTNCGSSFSAWKTVAFVPCVSNIAPVNGATNVAIPPTFNWAPIAGATSYQILISSDNGVTYPLSGVFTAPPGATNPNVFNSNTTYKWYVRAINGSDTSATTCGASNAFTFTTSAPPANDSCGAPVDITPSNSPLNGTTIGATQSLAPVTCATYTSTAPVRDVWYRVTALKTGSFTISVAGTSPFDAVLAAYSGTCGSLGTELGCADATVSGGTETLTISGATSGATYLVRVYSYGVNASGTYTITASGPALPITGINLTATRSGKNVQLGWQTLTEMNNAGFELQRSADGSSFTSFLKVASKAAAGNSSAAINYTAEDVKPFSGAAYYRLKQTDKDGKISYSNVAYLRGLAVSNLTLSAIYPNPTRDVLKAAVQSPMAEKITFVISDMTGKTISRQATSVISGDNTVNLNVANLPSGNYLLKAVCNNGCETAVQKFTKQ